MGNADYLAAFLHVLLPVAFEVTVWATRAVSMEGGWEGDSMPRVSLDSSRADRVLGLRGSL